MRFAFQSGRSATLRHLFRVDALDVHRESLQVGAELKAHQDRLVALPDDCPQDARVAALAAVERASKALTGIEIIAVLGAPVVKPVGSTALARGVSVVDALAALGFTPPEIAGLHLTAKGALTAAIGVVEPELPARSDRPPSLSPYPMQGARDLAARWLGYQDASDLRDKAGIGIGDDELAARVALVACGSPLASCGWPEWIRLGQASVDAHAALILCDLARGRR
jgi:hypothetical protein